MKLPDYMKPVKLYSIREFFEEFFIAVNDTDDSDFIDNDTPHVCYKGLRWVSLYQFTGNLLGVEMSWRYLSGSPTISLLFDSDMDDKKKHLTGGQLALLDTYFHILDISYNKEFASIEITVEL